MGLWILFHSLWLFTLSVLAVVRGFWYWSAVCLLYLDTEQMPYQPAQRRNASAWCPPLRRYMGRQPRVRLPSLVGMAIAFSGTSHHALLAEIPRVCSCDLASQGSVTEFKRHYLKHVASVVPDHYLSKCCSLCFFFCRHWLLVLFLSFSEMQLCISGFIGITGFLVFLVALFVLFGRS